MKNKPLILVLGEPYSTFSEILIKVFKFQIIKKFKRPIVIIGSLELLKKQMFKLNYSIEINPIKIRDIDRTKINNNSLNIIDVKFNFKKIFDKISSRSNNYIRKSFNIALHLLKKKLACGLINGPISKKHFLKKKYLGITEYLSKKTQLKKNGVMLIYNPFFSVCPVTTHLPISYVSRSLSSKKIIYNILEINKFFITNLNKKPFFAILGLNPHCETINNYSEENSIIKPAIKSLLKKKNKNIWSIFC